MISFIDITDFRIFRRVVLHLSLVNIFTGPNKAGKSSLIAAVEYLITRLNTWTDGKGSGIKSQVRLGAKTGHLRMGIAGLEVSAQCPPEAGSKQAAAQLQAALGLRNNADLNVELLQALLRACQLLDLDAAGQKKILCRTLRLELDADNFAPLVNALDARWPDLAEWFDEKTSRAQVAFGADAFYGFCYKQRPLAKGARDEHRRKLEDLQRKVGSGEPPGTPERLAAAQAKRDEIVRQLAELDAGGRPDLQVYQAQHAAWRIAFDARQAAEQAVRRADDAVDQAAGSSWGLTAPARPDPELEADCKAIGAEIAQIEQQSKAAWGAPATQDDAACADLGACRVRAMLAERQRQQQLGDQLSAARAREREVREQLQAAYRYNSVTTNLRVQQERLVEAKAALATVPEPGPEPQPPTVEVDPRRAQLEAALEGADTLVGTETTLVRQRWEWEHNRGELEKAVPRQLQLEDDVERWECLTAAFYAKDANSLPSRLLREGLGPFAADVDAACRKYFGFGVQFDHDPWQIWIVHEAGRVPQKQGCGGERMFLSAVLQVEIAQRTGFKLIILDEAQSLDAKLRPQLAAYLLAHDVQAIICLAAQEKTVIDAGGRKRVEFVRPSPPASDRVAYFWVEEGRIERIERHSSQPTAPAAAAATA